MAEVAKLITYDGVDAYDFAGANLFRIAFDTYSQYQIEEGKIEKRYPILCDEKVKADAVIEITQEIDPFGERARLHAEDPVRYQPIMWEERIVGELVVKWAKLYSISYTPQATAVSDAFFSNRNWIGELVVIIQDRFETKTLNTSTVNNINAVGGYSSVAPVNPGSNREGSFFRQYLSPDWTTPRMWRGWVGLKPAGDYGYSQFNPRFLFNTMTPALGQVTLVADADTFGGNRVQMNYSTTGLGSTLWHSVDMLNGIAGVTDWGDFAGRYIAILRCYVTGSSSTMGVRLDYGPGGAGSLSGTNRKGKTVYISATGTSQYYLINLGPVELPLFSTRYDLTHIGYSPSYNAISGIFFVIYSKMITGTPGTNHFNFNELILIPSDRLAHWTNNMQTHDVSLFMDEERAGILVGSSAAIIDGGHKITFPYDGGRFAYAIMDAGFSNITMTFDHIMNYREGYYLYAS